MIGHAAHGHPIAVHGVDSLLDHALGVDRSGTKERWLGAEHPPAHGANMDADLDGENDGLIQGDAEVLGHQPRGLAAALSCFL